MDKQSSKLRGVGLIFTAATCMGLSGTLTRGATRLEFFGADLAAGQSIGAVMTVGRMLMGVVLFLALLLLMGKPALFRKTKLSPSIAVGGVMVGVSFAFYSVSTLLTTLANSVFLIYTGPLFCTLLARIIRKERISLFQGGCLAAVFVGMVMTMVLGSGEAASVEAYPHQALGNMLGLLSGVFYGISMFCNGYRPDCDPVVRGVWNFSFATLGSLLVCVALCSVWPLGEVNMAPANWGFAVALWVICGPLGMGCLFAAGRHLPAVEYATMSYWECVVSLVISVFLFSDPVTAGTLGGGALIIVGGMLPAFSSVLEARRTKRIERTQGNAGGSAGSLDEDMDLSPGL